MRNRINIVRIVGLVFVGSGLFLLAISSVDLIDRWQGGYHYASYGGMAGIAFTAILLLSAGILGLLKNRFFRLTGLISLVAGILLFSFYYFTELIPDLRSEPLWISLVFGIIGYGVILSFWLLLNNTNLLSALEEEGGFDRDRGDNILDIDLED